MPVYEVTIDGVTYEVESQTNLTDMQAYQYAKMQADQNSAAPKKGNLNPDDQRLMNRAAAMGGPAPVVSGNSTTAGTAVAPPEDDGLTKYERRKVDRADLARRAQAFREQAAEISALASADPTNVELAQAASDALQQAKALEKQAQASDSAGTGGMIGGVAGTLLGAPLGPAGMAVGGIAGGALGTLVGGLIDAKAEDMTEEEKQDYLVKRGIEALVLDTAGTLLFIGGGKVLGAIAKSKPGYKEWIKSAGWKAKPKYDTGLNAPKDKVLPGAAVYDDTITSPGQLTDATVRGAKAISSPKAGQTVTAGQLTDEPGIVEQVARTKDRGHFNEVQRSQAGRLQRIVGRLVDRAKAGTTQTGADLRTAVDDVERETKTYLKPVFEDLSKKYEEIVNFEPISKAAREALEADFRKRVHILTPAEKGWLRNLAAGGKKMSPSEAQELSSRLSAMARDLEDAVEPNSPMLRFITEKAVAVRQALDNALASEPQYAEARDLYKKMMNAVYNPSLKASRRGGESAAGDKVIKVGETEGIDALKQLESFARDLDTLTGKTAVGRSVNAARRGVHADFFEKYAGTPDALASLPARMGDPGFRRTFLAAFPEAKDRQLIEALSQAAQVAARLSKGTGGAPGVEAAAASGGRAIGSALTGGSSVGANAASLAARALSWIAPKTLSRALTEPAVKAELPRIARLIQAGKLGALNALPEATLKAMERLDKIATEEAPLAEE